MHEFTGIAKIEDTRSKYAVSYCEFIYKENNGDREW